MLCVYNVFYCTAMVLFPVTCSVLFGENIALLKQTINTRIYLKVFFLFQQQHFNPGFHVMFIFTFLHLVVNCTCAYRYNSTYTDFFVICYGYGVLCYLTDNFTLFDII